MWCKLHLKGVTRARDMVICMLPAPATRVCTQVSCLLLLLSTSCCFVRGGRREIRAPRLRSGLELVRKAPLIWSFEPCRVYPGLRVRPRCQRSQPCQRCFRDACRQLKLAVQAVKLAKVLLAAA